MSLGQSWLFQPLQAQDLRMMLWVSLFSGPWGEHFIKAGQIHNGKKLGKPISFLKTSKIIKYLGVNLTKEAKDLYRENDRTMLKEIKEDTNRRTACIFLWAGRLSIVKTSVLLRAISIVTLTKIPMPFSFCRNGKAILKFIWHHQRPQRVKTILRKKNKAGGFLLFFFFDFPAQSKATMINTGSRWHKHRCIHQRTD